jgi:hypothetical protein
MSWTTVNFGKYTGKTLPQIVLADPNYFFWLAEKLYGRLMTEAELLGKTSKEHQNPETHQEVGRGIST